jgi:poly-gamma-glutamate capsule biosynthesis protein CapA/YwtB (metallophosphatase superfamily)
MFFSKNKHAKAVNTDPIYPIRQNQAPQYEAVREGSNKKYFLFAALLIVIVMFILIGINKKASAPPKKGVQNNQSMVGSIRLIATGDFIAHDSLNEQARKPDGGYDYLQFMTDFKPVFAKADIKFCNQATVSAGKKYKISGYPVFNAPTQFAKDMGKLGCNLVNNASNHSFDKGQDAINSTLDVWDSVPGILAVAGENRSSQEQNKINYFSLKGSKFAFLAYTTYSNSPPPNSYGVNMYSEDFAKKQINEARQNGAQVIIVSMRWGTEYSTSINEQQNKQSQFLANQGVNLILGHGPHVLEPVKSLTSSGGEKTLVWYSLGNFINSQEPPETLFNGLAVIDFNPQTKKITKASYLPIYMHYEWSASQKAADDLLARKNLHLYLLDDANQKMLDSNQLDTTIKDQRDRIKQTLNSYDNVPILTKAQYFSQ